MLSDPVLDQAIGAFHALRDQVAAADRQAREFEGLLLPRLHPAYLELGRDLDAFERSVWEVLLAWPADRLGDLADILTFFQHATIGRLTIRELIDAANAEIISLN